MRIALIDPRLCTGCKTCKVNEFCERNAIIRETKEDIPFVDTFKCNGCLKCRDICKAVSEVYHPF